jgi:hypothetical protein
MPPSWPCNKRSTRIAHLARPARYVSAPASTCSWAREPSFLSLSSLKMTFRTYKTAE